MLNTMLIIYPILLFLDRFQSYFYNDDGFNYNYAQAKAAVGNFKEAEEVFNLVQSEKIKNDYTYLSWLARCCKYNTTVSRKAFNY